MRGITGYFLSLGRLIQRPWGVLVMLALLVAMAWVATILPMVSFSQQVAWQADPVWTPEANDTSYFHDSSIHDGWLNAQVWTIAGVLIVVLMFAFSFLDALLMLTASHRWPGLREACRAVARNLLPLTTLTIVAVGWIVAAAGLTHGLLGPRISDWAATMDSERSALIVEAIPDLLWWTLSIPGWLAADLARARLVFRGARSGIVSFGWGLTRSLTPAPWLAGLLALAVDSGLVLVAAQLRVVWDPRTSASLIVALAAILAIMAARVVGHGAYVGAIGRIVMPEESLVE